MKPHFHKVPIGAENSFSIRHDTRPNFGTLWHYHPELELHYIVRGEGTQYIGDNVSNFSGGDMVLLGQNLPHTWRCKEEYFAGNEHIEVEAYVLHFHPTCFGKDFLSLPEAYLIPRLFEKAKKGLKIYGESKLKLVELLDSLLEARSIERVIYLLSVLKVLSETDEYDTIAPAYAFSHLSSELEMVRLEKIYSYVLAHYKEKIALEEVASLASLSPTSFCRYFKGMTKKTFSDFLTEIRISNACRAIIEDKLPTEVICFDSGFNNVSNFYRHFKKVTGMTPFEYRRKYLRQV